MTTTWASKEPDTSALYTLDLTTTLQGRTISSAGVSVSPFGSAELIVESVSVAALVVSVRVRGGVPGRAYLVKTALVLDNTETFEAMAQIAISRTLGVWPAPVAPNAGYSTPVAWAA